MKKQLRQMLAVAFIALVSSTLFTGCATICANRMQTVHLFLTPKDLDVKVDGQAVADSKPSDKSSDAPYYSKDQFATSANYATEVVTQFFITSIRVRGFKTHTITFHSDAMNKTATITVAPKFNFTWVWGDLISFGPLGWLVDGLTGKWKNIRPNYLDVAAILNGTPQHSKGQLKRMTKKKIRKNG